MHNAEHRVSLFGETRGGRAKAASGGSREAAAIATANNAAGAAKRIIDASVLMASPRRILRTILAL